MEKNIFNDSSEQYVTANNEDKVLKSVMSKVAKYIDNFEGVMTDYDGDTACITVNNNYFSDEEQFAIECYTSDVINYCNNHKPQYELIGIYVLDDVVILKVKV